EAESGVGKTRLLDELARRWSDRGRWVLRGEAEQETAQVPYQALGGVAAEVVARTAGDPSLRDSMRAAVSGRAPAIRSALPQLGASRAVRPPPDPGPGPP